MADNYRRFKDEPEDAYIYRVCLDKEAIGTWDDVANIINTELGFDYTSSAYRKKFQYFNKVFFSDNKFSKTEELLEDIKSERRKLEYEKVKFRDERMAYNRAIRSVSRFDHLEEVMEKAIKAYEPVDDWETCCSSREQSTREAVIMVSDVHAGVGANNAFNKFSRDILAARLKTYSHNIIQISFDHMVNKIHIILGGDLIQGALRTSSRVENTENVIEQVITASEVLSDFVYHLHPLFKEINVYSVSGNHSRLFPNKEEHLKGENLDRLIPHYMAAKLQNCDNVVFHENTIDESIGSFEVLGRQIYFVHGDKDSRENVVQKLTLMTGKKPDVIFMGHRHTNALTTMYDTKIVECGCVSGNDSYCIDKRLRNLPEQVVAIFEKTKGFTCLYDVKLEVG